MNIIDNPARSSSLRTSRTAEFLADVLRGLRLPSKELPCKYFYDEANARLKQATKGRVRVKDITIWETDTTTATYSE